MRSLHRKAQPARHQRRRQVDVDVVLLEPVLVADLDRVAEALGGKEGGLGALALDDRVGRQGRAVNDDRQIPRGERRFAQYGADRFEDGAFGSLPGGQDLGAVAPPGRFERHIREGAADIDAQSSAFHHALSSSRPQGVECSRRRRQCQSAHTAGGCVAAAPADFRFRGRSGCRATAGRRRGSRSRGRSAADKSALPCPGLSRTTLSAYERGTPPRT